MTHTIKRLLLSIVFLSATSVYAAGSYDGERNAFNRFHGQGTYTYTNGNVYAGEWKDGRKSGKGKQTWANGDVYDGQWLENRENGQGTMTWANGDEYVGQWAGGKRHGQGTMTWADGSRYEGEWNRGKRHGYGNYTAANGDVYKGEWQAGERHGQGTLVRANGEKLVGTWSEGWLTGDANVTLADGSRFTGPVKANKPHGKGVCKKGGSLFPCEYKNGALVVKKAKAKPKPKPKPKPQPVATPKPKPKPAPKPAVVKTPEPKPQPKPAVVTPAKPANPLAGTAKSAAPVKKEAVKEAVKKVKPKAEPTSNNPLAGTAKSAKPSPLAGTAKGANPSNAKSESAPEPEPVVEEPEEESTSSPRRRSPRGASLDSSGALEAIAALTATPPAAGKRFSFAHDWQNTGTSNLVEAWVERDVNKIGDLKIRAEGDYVVVLMIDEYFGPGEYELKYFKGTITKPGVASYQTTSSQPGLVRITEETDKLIKGEFEFKGYRNGNPVTGDSRIVRAGEFVLPKQ